MVGRTQNMVTFGLGLVGDIPAAQKAINDVANVVSATPIRLRIESTGDMQTQLGDMEGFFDEMEKGAVNLEKLSVDFVHFKDNIAGLDFKVPIKAYKEVRGETGEVIKETQEFNKALVETYEASKNIEKVKVSQAVYNVGSATRSAEKDVKGMVKSLDNISVSAGNFINKSQNMSSRAVTDARNIAEAIKAEKEQFDAAFGAQQWDKAQQHGDRIKELAVKFRELKGAVDQGANAVQAWGTRISNAIKQTISYSLSLGLVYKARQLLNNAIKYAIDLNTEMVKIQVLQAEGAQTPEEINALAQSFNELGKEMGASTLEIARGSVEWFRQGRTVSETQELMKSALMLGKLGAMSAADATNYLTSITNAFKIEAEDTVKVVDKLIAVDNIAATSAGELATAMRYTSESAAIAGVSMEQLISYIATVSTVTRQNAEMIGQAFKTMFARMTLIEGGGKDEEGWTISKVEAALKDVDIAMKNSEGNFRNMGNVLEEIAGKWNYLSERERMEIAIAIGGVRQKEPFLVLMDNMNLALGYQAEQTNALGLAWERYGIYLESVEAKQGKLKAQTEDLMTSFMSSDFVGGFYDLANATLEWVNNLGGIPVILAAISPLLIAITSNAIISGISALIGGITSLSIALGGAAIAGAPLLLVIGGLVALGYAVGAFFSNKAKKAEEAKKKIEEVTAATDEYLNALKKFPKEQGNIVEIFREIQSLTAQKEAGTLDEEGMKKLVDLGNELYSILPTLKYSFDEMGNAILDSSVKLEELKEQSVDYFLSTKQEGTDLVTYFNNIANEFSTAKEQLDASLEERDILSQILGSDDIEDAAQKFIGRVDRLVSKELAGTLLHGEKPASDAMKNLADKLQNILLLGLGGPETKRLISKALGDAVTEAATSQKSVSEASNAYIQMYSMILGRTEPHYVELRTLMEESAMSNPALINAMAEAETNARKKAAEKVINEIKDYYSSLWSIGGENTALIQSQNEEYLAQAEVIDNLGTKFGNLLTVFEDSASTSEDFKNALIEVVTEINSLNEAGKNLPIINIEEFLQAFKDRDIDALEDYKKELEDIILDTDRLAELGPEAQTSLVALWRGVSAAVEETTYKVNVFGDEMELTQSQADAVLSNLSSALWETAGDAEAGLRMVADDGREIIAYSASDIQSFVEGGYMSFTNFIMMITEYAAKSASDLARHISLVMSAISMGIDIFPTFKPSGGGGGDGGGGKDPNQQKVDDLNDEIKDKREEISDLREEISDARDDLKDALEPINDAYEKAIDLIEKQIDDLETLKDKFGDYIDDQKESLRTAKETADFYESIKEKEEDLATLKTRLALLAGDDSEEAQAKRIELTEQITKLEEDIEKETNDRIYDVKMDALDKEKDAYDDMIDAKIDALEILRQEEEDRHQELLDDMQDEFDLFEDLKLKEIETLEDEIKVIEKQRDALQDLIGESGGGGGGGGWSGAADAVDIYGQLAGEVIARLSPKIQSMVDDLGLANDRMLLLAEYFLRQKGNIEDAIDALERYIRKLSLLPEPIISGGKKSLHPTGAPDDEGHQGGIMEKHHAGNSFAGGLRSNEVFAKLLKGEYVATEMQMKNFLNNVMPKIAMQMGPTLRHRTGESVQKAGDVNIDVDIIVEGSLDKTVVPVLKKEMMKEIIKALELRGIRRGASVFNV